MCNCTTDFDDDERNAQLSAYDAYAKEMASPEYAAENERILSVPGQVSENQLDEEYDWYREDLVEAIEQKAYWTGLVDGMMRD